MDTRSLSITSTGRVSDTGSPQNSALLYYENPTGKVSALLQHGWEWVDITSQQSKSLPDEFHNAPYAESSKTLYESDDSNLTFRAPFSSGANWLTSGIGALFYSPSNAPSASGGQPVSIWYDGYTIGPTGSGNFSGSMHDQIRVSRMVMPKLTFTVATPMDFRSHYSIQDYILINRSDIAMFSSAAAIWINGTQPAMINTGEAPDNAFPFARLGSVTLADQSATFLYHQMNGTAFSEEQWDASRNAWLPSVYIIVSDD